MSTDSPQERPRVTCICGVSFYVDSAIMVWLHKDCHKARFINDSKSPPSEIGMSPETRSDWDAAIRAHPEKFAYAQTNAAAQTPPEAVIPGRSTEPASAAPSDDKLEELLRHAFRLGQMECEDRSSDVDWDARLQELIDKSARSATGDTRDAARYRWLRGNPDSDIVLIQDSPVGWNGSRYMCLDMAWKPVLEGRTYTPEHLDAAIDKAMAATDSGSDK